MAVEISLKKQSEFPLLEKYKEVFAVDKFTIFAYKDAIYCDYRLTPDLYVHELTHIDQQQVYGVDSWVESYLSDPTFRLEQELQAYRAQLKSIKDREKRNKVRIESAKALGSSLYGSIINTSEALKLLM